MGCGQWPGPVERLHAPVLPHMGWNTVAAGAGSRLFAGIDPGTRFYFVHSYAATALPMPPSERMTPPLISWATHGEPFIAAVENGPLWRPSSTRRNPATPVRRCWRTGWRWCDDRPVVRNSGSPGAVRPGPCGSGSAAAREPVLPGRAALTLLPAVDVAGGKAVRLVQGAAGTETDYGEPLQAALAWQAAGAQWLHLVDLDAAFGRGSNAELLASVVGRLDIAVELSGGIRDDASLAAALATGCARVNVGTAALENPDWVRAAIAEHGEQDRGGPGRARHPARRPGLDPRGRRAG